MMYPKKLKIILKLTFWLSENDYGVAALSELNLTASEIVVQTLKSIGQF